AEQAPYFFRYPGEAGSELKPPFPLWQLNLCRESYGVQGRGPWWKAHHGKFYARAAGTNGGPTDIVIRYFYPMLPGFWYDLDLNRTNDVPAGTCLAWLDHRPGG